MGQCLGRRRPARAAISFIPLYLDGQQPYATLDATRREEASDSDEEGAWVETWGTSGARASGSQADRNREKALRGLHRTQGRLNRQQRALSERQQHARQQAVTTWAQRPERRAADPVQYDDCRRRAHLHLYEADQLAARSRAITSIEMQLTTLKTQLATMSVTADALTLMNEYSTTIASEVKALRETVDLDALMRTIDQNARDLDAIQGTLDDAVLTDGIDEAELEATLDLLEQEYSRTSLRQTLSRQQPAPRDEVLGAIPDPRRLLGMLQ